ncbi:hypothetical protein PUN28_007752 [Cardiocondyla obscurior]|uniref:Uncharacterized protein n=1 Tax=Cardiocondyla obscurior TaxID=286306 RepID=A0AAW2FVP3_9HYME
MRLTPRRRMYEFCLPAPAKLPRRHRRGKNFLGVTNGIPTSPRQPTNSIRAQFDTLNGTDNESSINLTLNAVANYCSSWLVKSQSTLIKIYTRARSLSPSLFLSLFLSLSFSVHINITKMQFLYTC